MACLKQENKKIKKKFCFYIRQNNYALTHFSTGINPGAYWSFLLFYVPEQGRRQDGESCGENCNLIWPTSTPSIHKHPFIASYVVM